MVVRADTGPILGVVSVVVQRQVQDRSLDVLQYLPLHIVLRIPQSFAWCAAIHKDITLRVAWKRS